LKITAIEDDYKMFFISFVALLNNIYLAGSIQLALAASCVQKILFTMLASPALASNMTTTTTTRKGCM
jgi:hypothetical protein